MADSGALCGEEATEAARKGASTRVKSPNGVGCTVDWKRILVVGLHGLSVDSWLGAL